MRSWLGLGVCLLVGCVSGSVSDERAPRASLGEDEEPEPRTDQEEPLFTFPDADGDNYTDAVDCDDTEPLVNPGALEHAGDGVDNDCDGVVDEDPEPCDEDDLPLEMTDPLQLAAALGLCQTAPVSGDPDTFTWGVTHVALVRVDGDYGVEPRQVGIMSEYGPQSPARAGRNLVVLSTGTARLPDDPGYVDPLPGAWYSFEVVDPPSGHPKTAPDCHLDPHDVGPENAALYDTVALSLEIRVPTNAQGFSFEFNFYSSEYYDYICSPYNDAFVTLLSSDIAVPAEQDGNICFDARGNPVSVNNGFFEYCVPSDEVLDFPCAGGTSLLEGTGYEPGQVGPEFEGSPNQNGATGWLVTSAPVRPGETIVLTFALWDAADGNLDSTVLLDNFQWLTEPAAPGPVTRRPSEPTPR